MKPRTTKIREEIEECEKCDDKSKCKNHKILLEEAKTIEAERNSYQQIRTGIKGDPTPDHEYGR